MRDASLRQITLHPSCPDVLVARLGGSVSADDVDAWQVSLDQTLARIPDGATFRLLVDLRDYEPADLDAHKRMRPIVPLTLAAYGFRTGLLDLVGADDLPLTHTRGIRCTAVAHVHHDATKMTEYQARVGRAEERWFVNREEAERWICGTR